MEDYEISMKPEVFRSFSLKINVDNISKLRLLRHLFCISDTQLKSTIEGSYAYDPTLDDTKWVDNLSAELDDICKDMAVTL